MSNFELPARPWGEKEISLMKANEVLLDNETRVELGLKESEDAPESTPAAEPTPSEGGEDTAPEATPEQAEPVVLNSDGTAPTDDVETPEVVNTPEAEEKKEGEETVNNQTA